MDRKYRNLAIHLGEQPIALQVFIRYLDTKFVREFDEVLEVRAPRSSASVQRS